MNDEYYIKMQDYKSVDKVKNADDNFQKLMLCK